MKRQGPTNKSGRRLLTVWIPRGLESPLARGVQQAGTDQSKYVRAAIREKLARHGVQLPFEKHS
jgi:hypothetical protein